MFLCGAAIAGPSAVVCTRLLGALLAVALLYRLHEVEQLVGSTKLATLVVLALFIHTPLTLFWLAFDAMEVGFGVRSPLSARLRSVLVCRGTGCVLTALVVLYARLVPAVRHVRVLGVRVSTKALVYALWAAFLWVEAPLCVTGVVAGALAGWAFTVGEVPVRLPRWLASFCAALVRPFFDFSFAPLPPALHHQQQQEDDGNSGEEGAEANREAEEEPEVPPGAETLRNRGRNDQVDEQEEQEEH